MTAPTGPSNGAPCVSAIIVQYKNDPALLRCVRSLEKSNYQNLEIIVIDNGPTPTRPDWLEDVSLPIRYFTSEENLGFGAACNEGARQSRCPYLFFLNNDIEVDSDCIRVLARTLDRDPSLGLVQPKMLDFANRTQFHSSAGGGLIDVFGYPFARGRILDRTEPDHGQYDDPVEVFWGGGAALFAREEIDLAWRMHLRGRHRAVYAPAARIYHVGCPHLDRDNPLRMYYVHRNALVMLLKNHSAGALCLVLPVRIVLDIATGLGALLRGRPRRALAICRAFAYVASHFREIMLRRHSVPRRDESAPRKRMYRGSVMLRFLLDRGRVSRTIRRVSVAGYKSPEGPVA
jgi:GT2 family glycosyltransferase